MQGDPKVIEYLNKGVRSELTAISQYWLHFRLLNHWGLLEMAKVWRKESIEEMVHADKFIDRILFLDGFPNLQVLDPLRIGQDVKEVIECDLAAEVEARSLYQEAATSPCSSALPLFRIIPIRVQGTTIPARACCAHKRRWRTGYVENREARGAA